MRFIKEKHSDRTLKDLYRHLLKPRLVEEKMLRLLRQGKVTKWFSGIGQEAISVGATRAMKEDEYILPMHRNLGVFTSRDVPLNRLFSQFQGKQNGFTKGRDRSFHFGSKEHAIFGMISHLGPQLSVADGIALAHKLNDERKVTLVFTGEGGTSEGEFHEALNVAAVWELPVIFLVENNGYSISTPLQEQYKIKSFKEKGLAYGIEVEVIDGNNILEVYDTIKKTANKIRRKPRPVLIEALTFRMRGHEESSGVDYVPEDLLREWAKKDPVYNYEQFLLKQKILNVEEIEVYKRAINKEIEEGLEAAESDNFAQPSAQLEVSDLYKEHLPSIHYPQNDTAREIRYVDAINEALHQSMEKYPQLLLMGQDIAEYGGVFKVTEGLVEKFGKQRVRNTPLCESAIVGIGLGLSAENFKSVIEIQFADFVTCGFNQIVNNLAKTHYRWGQHADVVIRMPSGAGVGAGPFHSQSTEAWFYRVPGLQIVYPSSPYSAKGLLNAAIESPNPVLFYEHKKLYRSITEETPENYYTIPIGKAKLIHSGDEVTVITYGACVHWVSELIEKHHYDIELIDLQSIMPWDRELIIESVRRTGKGMIITEDTLTGSIASDMASVITEECFQYLDAPIKRIGSLDTPIPFASELEENFLPKGKIQSLLEELIAY